MSIKIFDDQIPCDELEVQPKTLEFYWYDDLVIAFPFILSVVITYYFFKFKKKTNKKESEVETTTLYRNTTLNTLMISTSLSLVGIIQQDAHQYYGEFTKSILDIFARLIALVMVFPFWKLFRKSKNTIGSYMFQRFMNNQVGCYILYVMTIIASLNTILMCSSGIVTAAEALRIDSTTLFALCSLFASVVYAIGELRVVCWIAILSFLLILLSKLIFLINGAKVIMENSIKFSIPEVPLFVSYHATSFRYLIENIFLNVILLFGNNTGLQFYKSTGSRQNSYVAVAVSFMLTSVIYIMNDVSGQVLFAYKHQALNNVSNEIETLNNAPFAFLDSTSTSYFSGLLLCSGILLGNFQILSVIQSIWADFRINIENFRCKILKNSEAYLSHYKGIMYLGISMSIILTLIWNSNLHPVDLRGIFYALSISIIPNIVLLIWLAALFPQITGDGIWVVIPSSTATFIWIVVFTDPGGGVEKIRTINNSYIARPPKGSPESGNYNALKDQLIGQSIGILIFIILLMIITKTVKRKRKTTDDDLYIQSALTYWTNFYIKRRVMNVRKNNRFRLTSATAAPTDSKISVRRSSALVRG